MPYSADLKALPNVSFTWIPSTKPEMNTGTPKTFGLTIPATVQPVQRPGRMSWRLTTRASQPANRGGRQSRYASELKKVNRGPLLVCSCSPRRPALCFCREDPFNPESAMIPSPSGNSRDLCPEWKLRESVEALWVSSRRPR